MDIIKKCLIYGLIDPIDKQLRYVGKTTRGKRRFAEHFFPSRYKPKAQHIYRWIDKLVAKKYTFTYVENI